MAFALIRLGNISESRRPGTGPAPIANEHTNLQNTVVLFILFLYNNMLHLRLMWQLYPIRTITGLLVKLKK